MRRGPEFPAFVEFLIFVGAVFGLLVLASLFGANQ